MTKVSVVIPIYNAEAYIENCLESICHQTLKDIEIICVDDGSTDVSGALIRKVSDMDSRVHYIRQNNMGAGAARNTGLKKSHRQVSSLSGRG